MTIHGEAHKFLCDYGEAMIENLKFRKVLDRIKFGPMDIEEESPLQIYFRGIQRRCRPMVHMRKR